RKQEEQRTTHQPKDNLVNAKRPDAVASHRAFPRAWANDRHPLREPITDDFSVTGVSGHRTLAPPDNSGRCYGIQNSKQEGWRRPTSDWTESRFAARRQKKRGAGGI